MSFWTGFSSLFDWMVPKTLDESLGDLDNNMQELYDRMGWGIYNNPLEQEEYKRQNRLYDNPTESQKSWFEE